MSWGMKKTEGGKKNGKGRWCKRAYAKQGANKQRRQQDKTQTQDR